MDNGNSSNNEGNQSNLINAGNGTLAAPHDGSLEAVIALFLMEQQVMPSSRKAYGWAVRRFFRWCSEAGRKLPELSRADVVGYIDALAAAGFSPKSIASYTVAVRRFFAWLDSHGKYPNIAIGLKGPRKSKEGFVKMHLDRDERSALLDAAKRRGLRDYAIVNLMLRNGLRTIEVSRLDAGDICTRKGVRILRLWRKGSLSKDDYAVLTDESYAPIEEYLKSRGPVLAGAPLFATDGDGHRGGRMTPRRVQQVVRDCLDEIGLTTREYSPHSLRHTTAVAILEAGGSIFDVQTVLGHASPETSQIYTRSAEEDRRLRNPPEEIIRDAFGNAKDKQ